MQDLVAVTALEAEANPFRDQVSQGRHQNDADLQEPGHPVHRHMERGREDVVATGYPEEEVEDDEGDAESGAGGHVARPVENVPGPIGADDLLLDPRVDRKRDQDEAGYHYRRYEHAQRQRMPEDTDLPWRHQPQRAIQEGEIPVR